MENIVKTVELICDSDGHNKIWRATLFDNLEDGDCLCEWGRNDGSDLQEKLFEGVGEKYLDKKVKEKIKKNYRLS